MRRGDGRAMRGGGRRITLVIGRQDGRTAALPSVLAQVRSGAASEHDEGGDHALARSAESSDRRTRLSQANPDRTLFRGFCLSCAKNRRRSGRPHARDGGCEDQGRGEGHMVSKRGISRSSVSRRVHHRRTADRDRAHSRGVARDMNWRLLDLRAEIAPPFSAKRGRWPEGPDGVWKAALDRRRFAVTVAQSGLRRSSGPYPIRRSAPPSPAKLGKAKPNA
jgi:hypothetical protein